MERPDFGFAFSIALGPQFRRRFRQTRFGCLAAAMSASVCCFGQRFEDHPPYGDSRGLTSASGRNESLKEIMFRRNTRLARNLELAAGMKSFQSLALPHAKVLSGFQRKGYGEKWGKFSAVDASQLA